ncbi:hypothetical protein BGW80DRAFT_1423739 [Lactifluus volemus]|nr:hypothetical protein BGW80DRAFT_1423739 [Lactifluus volemus]
MPNRATLLDYRVVLSTCSSAARLQMLNIPVFSNASTNVILAGDCCQLEPSLSRHIPLGLVWGIVICSGFSLSLSTLTSGDTGSLIFSRIGTRMQLSHGQIGTYTG